MKLCGFEAGNDQPIFLKTFELQVAQFEQTLLAQGVDLSSDSGQVQLAQVAVHGRGGFVLKGVQESCPDASVAHDRFEQSAMRGDVGLLRRQIDLARQFAKACLDHGVDPVAEGRLLTGRLPVCVGRRLACFDARAGHMRKVPTEFDQSFAGRLELREQN